MASGRRALFAQSDRSYVADDRARQSPAGHHSQGLDVRLGAGVHGVRVDIYVVGYNDRVHNYLQQVQQGFMGVAEMRGIYCIIRVIIIIIVNFC